MGLDLSTVVEPARPPRLAYEYRYRRDQDRARWAAARRRAERLYQQRRVLQHELDFTDGSTVYRWCRFLWKERCGSLAQKKLARRFMLSYRNNTISKRGLRYWRRKFKSVGLL